MATGKLAQVRSGCVPDSYSLRIGLMNCRYARVSTGGQSVAARVAELTATGCEKVFSETASGAKTDCAPLKRAMASLGSGDVLSITVAVASDI